MEKGKCNTQRLKKENKKQAVAYRGAKTMEEEMSKSRKTGKDDDTKK